MKKNLQRIIGLPEKNPEPQPKLKYNQSTNQSLEEQKSTNLGESRLDDSSRLNQSNTHQKLNNSQQFLKSNKTFIKPDLKKSRNAVFQVHMKNVHSNEKIEAKLQNNYDTCKFTELLQVFKHKRKHGGLHGIEETLHKKFRLRQTDSIGRLASPRRVSTLKLVRQESSMSFNKEPRFKGENTLMPSVKQESTIHKTEQEEKLGSNRGSIWQKEEPDSPRLSILGDQSQDRRLSPESHQTRSPRSKKQIESDKMFGFQSLTKNKQHMRSNSDAPGYLQPTAAASSHKRKNTEDKRMTLMTQPYIKSFKKIDENRPQICKNEFRIVPISEATEKLEGEGQSVTEADDTFSNKERLATSKPV